VQHTQPPGEAQGYEVQRFLGSGAFGEVWVGIDRTTGRRVAIKFYLHRGGLDWTLLSREVEKLVFLSADRYVVQLLDVGWHAEPPYYVMEYMEHGSLEDVLGERGALPAHEAVDLFRDVAVGLSHAHSKGVLHCDLKPANILLDQDRRPRLADFGQSRLSHEQTPALGTLFYMAPEQASLEAVPDAAWDVYALGSLLYSMLTGNPPYRTEDSLIRIEAAPDLPERLMRYRREITTAPRPEQHRTVPGVDRALAEIVDSCLATNPARRYPNVQAVLDALAAREEARTRRPLLVLGLIGPILLLLIMVIFSWRAFSSAMSRSESLVREQTYRSNEFTAKYVAKSFEAEIADYFTIAAQEATRPDFQIPLKALLSRESLTQLNDPAIEDSALDALRQRFLQDPQQRVLTAYLDGRLRAFNADPRPDAPKLASIFVLDPMGVILASAYANEPISTAVGRNFSWRTYFHGHPEDRPPGRPRQPPEHLQFTSLSAAWKSSATDRWKVAISTPVYDGSAAGGEFLGVIALSLNVGDFAVFRGRERLTDYFAVLIDDRPGERRGTILQHPFFEARPPARDFQVPGPLLEEVRKGPVYHYQDPVAEDPTGRDYAGFWIAATEPVRLPSHSHGLGQNNGDNGTRLLVLVQRSASTAAAPVQQLGRSLAVEGMTALMVVIGVVIALWLIVFRISGGRAWLRTRRLPSKSESTPANTSSTVAMPPPGNR
jgi:serine/threonine protein kinase